MCVYGWERKVARVVTNARLRFVVILALIKLASKHLWLTTPVSTWAPRTNRLANSFAWPCLPYLAWETKKSLVFLSNTVYIPELVACSSFVWFFTPFNSTKTLFSYGVRYNELRGRVRKLDTIKEMGKSHIWPYLRATKWRLESDRMYYRNYCIP